MSFVFPNIEISDLLRGDPEVNYRASVRLTSGNANWTGSASLAYSDPTLTVSALSAGTTLGLVDSVEPSVGDRILVKDLASAGAANDAGYFGIWRVTGGTTTTLTLERDEDLIDGDSALSIFTYVREGTGYANSSWIQTNNVTVASDGSNDQSWRLMTPGSGTLSNTLPISSGGTGTNTLSPGTRLIQVNSGATALETTTQPVVEELRDTNNNELIVFTGTASAVNELTVTNAATGNNVILGTSGDDADVGLTILTKGDGNVLFTTDSAATKPQLQIADLTGGETVNIQVPDTLTSTYTLTLPPDDGTVGQFLQTDGNGVLTWQTITSNLSTFVYNISSQQIVVSNTSYVTIGYFPWDASRYEAGGAAALSSGLLQWEAIIGGGRDIELRIGWTGSETSVLDLTGGSAVTASGFRSDTLTLPSATTDRRIEVQVRRTTGATPNPIIFGMFLEFILA